MKEHPGILADIQYAERGDIDRESYMVKIANGKQVITGKLGALHPERFATCGK